jgi:hypothetical protein
MPLALGQLLRSKDGFLGFLGIFVEIHVSIPYPPTAGRQPQSTAAS